jgi:hypothetical protein
MPGVQDTVEIEEVLARLRGIVATRRLRIAEFLRDSDPLRSGVIAASRLRGGLHSAGIDLSEAEYSAIVSHFSGAPKRPEGVRWLDFADTLDAVFVTKNLERMPAAVTLASPARRGIGGPAPLSPVAVSLPKPLSEASVSMPEDAHRILRRVAAWAAPRRADFLPFFEDFDRLRCGRVVPGKFCQGLEACGVKMLPADVQILAAPFAIGSAGDIDYRTFLALLSEGTALSSRSDCIL